MARGGKVAGPGGAPPRWADPRNPRAAQQAAAEQEAAERQAEIEAREAGRVADPGPEPDGDGGP